MEIVVFGLSWNEYQLHERIQKLENKEKKHYN
jgi:hypothetical protein